MTPDVAAKTVGIVGVGKMGTPIGANLVERGWRVLGYRRSPMDAFVEVGGEPTGSPRAIAEECEQIITIMPDADALHDVVFGADGLLAADTSPVVVEMSTVAPHDKHPARKALRDAGGDLLDCPISGMPGMVRPRLATVYASGDPDSVALVTPLLDDIGPWHAVGEFGNGAKFKYIANLLVATHIAVAAEALVLAERLGLAPDVVRDVISGSVASSGMFDRRVPMMLNGDWDKRPGPISTLHEILVQIERAAESVEAPLPLFAQAKQLYDEALAEGWGDLDAAALYLRLRGDGRPAL